MATEKWIAGSLQPSWGNAFTSAVLNGLGTGNALLSDISINNSSALDEYADFSMSLVSLAAVAPNFVGVYLYPMNSDGTSYGDGRFGAAATGPPPSSYWVGNVVMVAATQAQMGTTRGILLPPGIFKFCLFNQMGVSFGNGNVAQFRTYNRQVS